MSLGKIVATYPYCDETGQLLFEVVRFDPKDFRQRRPLEGGRWGWDLHGVRRVPFLLDQLAKQPGADVVIVEGEKDALALNGMGILATTFAGGAGFMWDAELDACFASRRVYLVPDRDEPGRLLMKRIAKGIHRAALSVKQINLPGVPLKGDVSDWLAMPGNDLAAFKTLMANAQHVDDGASDDLIRLERLNVSTIQWLWKPWLPAGKLCLIDGDPGQGKSFVTLDLAARLSRGDAFPDGIANPFGPVASLLISCEDGITDTVLPRLIALGADLNYIRAYQGKLEKGRAIKAPTLPDDMPKIAAMIRESRAKLVVIDPLMAFLGGTVNSISDQSVRQVLTPLANLAEAEGVTILFVRHLNKTNGKQAVYRGGGSIGIIAAMRTAMLVARHPHDRELRVLAMVKCNLAKEPESLGFRLAETNGDITVAWQGAVDLHANDLVGDVKEAMDPKQWLRDALAAGPRKAAEIFADWTADGLSERTLHRAKAALAVVSKQKRGPGGSEWYWLPPGQTDWPAASILEPLEPLGELDPPPRRSRRPAKADSGPYGDRY